MQVHYLKNVTSTFGGPTPNWRGWKGVFSRFGALKIESFVFKKVAQVKPKFCLVFLGE